MFKKLTAVCLCLTLILTTAGSVYAEPADPSAGKAADSSEGSGDEDKAAAEDRETAAPEADASETGSADGTVKTDADGEAEDAGSSADAQEAGNAGETDDASDADTAEGTDDAGAAEASDETDEGTDEEPELIEEDPEDELPLNELALSKVTSGFYKIGSINKGLSLDVSGGTKVDGANIQVHRPNGTDAQIFYLSDNGDGTFAVEALGSDKVLDCKSSGKTAGTNIQLWTKKDKHRAQTWQIFNDSGYARFVNPNSGLALTVSGTNVVLGANTGNVNTRWLLTKLNMDMSSFSVSDLYNDYAYTGEPVEPYNDVKVTTTRRSDVATTESHPGYYMTGGLDIPQMSIGNYGTSCGPGAVAMVISYLRGVKTTPAEIRSRWPQYAYNLHYLTSAAASYYGVGSVYTNGPQNNHETADINKAIAALKNGQPVIAYEEGLSIFSMTGNSHFIVLRGVTPDGMIMVNDPNGSYPFYAHDVSTFEYTLFTPAQVAANAKEFYIFNKKSEGAQYTYTQSVTLQRDVDYTVEFRDNIESGTAKAIVRGLNGYSGTVTKRFGIVDKTVDIVSGMAYELVSAKNPVLALDVDNGSTEIRANVRVHTRNKTAAQQWYFIRNDDDTWTIKNVGSGLVLDAQGGEVADRTNVWQYRQNGTDAQKWTLRDQGDGSLVIVNVKSGKCLDLAGGSIANNTNLQLYRIQKTAETIEAQRFYPAETSADKCLDGSYMICSAADSTLVLDIENGSKDKRAGLLLSGADAAKEPVFDFLLCGPGLYRITNKESGMVLDVRGGTFANKTPIQQYKWNNTPAQLWKVISHDNGAVAFASALGSGKVIDIAGGLIGSGTALWLYKEQTVPEKMQAQLFILEPMGNTNR